MEQPRSLFLEVVALVAGTVLLAVAGTMLLEDDAAGAGFAVFVAAWGLAALLVGAVSAGIRMAGWATQPPAATGSPPD